MKWNSYKGLEMSESGEVRNAETKQLAKETPSGYVLPFGGYVLRSTLIVRLYPNGLKKINATLSEGLREVATQTPEPIKTEVKAETIKQLREVIDRAKLKPSKVVHAKLNNKQDDAKLKRGRKEGTKQGKNHPAFKGYYIINGKEYDSADKASKAEGIHIRSVIKFCKIGMTFKPE